MNMYAQLMLGIGGIASGQLIKRLNVFQGLHIMNREYGSGADIWPRHMSKREIKIGSNHGISSGKKLIANPGTVINEIDKRIKSLK